MRKIKYFILFLTVTLVFAGCANSRTAIEKVNENTGVNVGNTVDNTITDEDSGTTVPMRDFFLPEGSVAHFKSEGNEIAELKVEVAQPYENYFVVYENNGEAFVRRTFKIESDQINILEEKTVNYEETFPTIEEVEAMKPTGIYLQKPFSEGTVFDGWTIMKTGITVETPYRTFDNAFVIEKNDENIVNRKYFVQGYGEVKREAISTTENDEKLIVTSTLESVDQ